MFRTLRFALTAALLVNLAGAAQPAGAKTLCGAFDPPVTDFDYSFYVLDKVKTKPGSHGMVSGYLISADASASAPFSGSYVTYNEFLVQLAVTFGTSQSYFGPVTFQLNFSAPIDELTTGEGYLTVIDGNHSSVTFPGVGIVTTPADCKTVPDLPVF